MPGSTFRNVNLLMRTVVLGGLLALGGWWTLFLRSSLTEHERELAASHAELSEVRLDLDRRRKQVDELGRALEQREAQIRELKDEVLEKERENEALRIAKRLLLIEHRVARLEVLAQGSSGGNPETGEPEQVRTTVRFTELDGEGQPLGPGRELVVEGKTIYVESLVIQFEDSYVEQGDPLRGTSLCLFRRLFGEEQRPNEGVAIDPTGQQPLIYGGDTTPSPLHRELWERFWDYANDPDLARTLGVRAMQGEAPYIEARPGKTYRLELRSSGGLTIVPE